MADNISLTNSTKLLELKSIPNPSAVGTFSNPLTHQFFLDLLVVFTEQFDANWDDIPPSPQFNPPDNEYIEQFDVSWDGL